MHCARKRTRHYMVQNGFQDVDGCIYDLELKDEAEIPSRPL